MAHPPLAITALGFIRFLGDYSVQVLQKQETGGVRRT